MPLYQWLLLAIYILAWIGLFVCFKFSMRYVDYSISRKHVHYFKKFVLPATEFDCVTIIGDWAYIENSNFVIIWRLSTKTFSSKCKLTNKMYHLHGSSSWSYVHKDLTDQLIHKFGKMNTTHGNHFDRDTLVDSVVLSYEQSQETVS